nr:polyadenylate-binding protein 7-like [Ipomoea batatas]
MVFVSFPADQSADCSEDEEDMKFALKIQSLSLASFPSPSLPFIQTGLSDDAQAGAIAAIVESFKCAPNSTFSIPLRIVSRLLQQDMSPNLSRKQEREVPREDLKFHQSQKIMPHDNDGVCKGFGFVSFFPNFNPGDAKKAMDSLNGLSDDAQAGAIAAIVESFKCAPNSTFSIPLRIVSRLLQQEDHLREKFSKYGKVHKAIIMRDEKGKSRGFGFVNFYSHEDAKRAVDGLNGALLGSKQLVFVTSAKDHAS